MVVIVINVDITFNGEITMDLKQIHHQMLLSLMEKQQHQLKQQMHEIMPHLHITVVNLLQTIHGMNL